MSQQICDTEAAQIPIASQSKLIKSPSNFLFIFFNDHYKNLSSLQFRLMLIINSLLLFPSLPILLSFFQVAPICSSGFLLLTSSFFSLFHCLTSVTSLPAENLPTLAEKRGDTALTKCHTLWQHIRGRVYKYSFFDSA